jgi:outer membrane protein assembly factor BamB
MLKNLDKDDDGALSREEAEKEFGGFFDNQDANKDGKVSRDEWDMVIKFMTEGKDAGFALESGAKGDVKDSAFAWKLAKGLPYIASGIAYQNQYVMVRDGGIVHAVDLKTGKNVYQERAAEAGRYYASPVAANGHLYVTSLDEGVITVLKAGSEKAEVVAKNPPLGERTSATPAIADNTLYVRTAATLYAFAEQK